MVQEDSMSGSPKESLLGMGWNGGNTVLGFKNNRGSESEAQIIPQGPFFLMPLAL